ncbi:NAD-dependent epimerase/dehydratase family protein [Allosalinactinospora lopnorensis]|uniref:NAD-dependent epimerase/dehydratase family protein n=1 Tax=Allosalinactinospora lopnorensis TaxID=1352348 RepID=UPI000623EAA5|nr:NAD-dependent epimerase/dehydratase family protein [Allosalinactinospora lopnorensis]
MVAVTGAASDIGRMLVERLLSAAGSGAVGKVVAIDDHSEDIEGVTWEVADICDPRLAPRISGVDVLAHVDDDRSLETPPAERRTHNIRAAQTVLTAAAAERVPRVILLTSTMVYGAAPDNPVPMPEDAPVSPESGTGLIGDFAEIEDLAHLARRAHPGLSVTVVRPAPLVGPGLDTLLTRHFAAPRLLAVKGREQTWQFCHVDDLVSALEFLIVNEVDGKDGALAVGCDGSLSQAEAEEIAQLRSFEVPANVAFNATQRLHRVGITPASASELKFLVYPCVVDCATLREAGWRPEYGNAESLRALLEARAGKHALVGRNLGRKEATITVASAAGAAVAAVGTTAAIRYLRKRRKS